MHNYKTFQQMRY